jgi:hypothetical protein
MDLKEFRDLLPENLIFLALNNYLKVGLSQITRHPIV